MSRTPAHLAGSENRQCQRFRRSTTNGEILPPTHIGLTIHTDDNNRFTSLYKDNDKMATATALPPTNPDAIDRFFNVAERFVCTADNTTNVTLDPYLLEQQEAELQTLCGRSQRNQELIESESNSILAIECVLPKIDSDQARKLGPNGSDMSGNTTLETLSRESFESMKKKSLFGRRRKMLNLFRCFRPRNAADDVVTSPEAKDYEYRV